MKKMPDDIKLIRLALAEDAGRGDITTRALKLKGRIGRGVVIVRDAGVISGIGPFKKIFQTLSRSFSVRVLKNDGRSVKPGQEIIRIKGPLDSMLTGERTAMNIIGHLSGVATLTRAFADTIETFPAKIYDTRKTTPGMRAWEKAAVRHGGGANHRLGLYDMYLVKENHIAAAGGLEAAMRLAIAHRQKTKARLEVEVRNLSELKKVLPFKPDYILLDNFTVPGLRKAVSVAKSIRPGIFLEASGKIDLKTVKRVAATGIDRISIGKLTHSAPALDLSFKVID
jgi:nicotinate-nucleotide pyrophosphorylase (carboxylating)